MRVVGVIGFGLVLAIGGCSAPGDTPTADGSSVVANAQEQQRDFVQCLRDHGVTVADPEPGAALQLDKNDPATRAALLACRELAPPGSDRTKIDVDLDQQRQYASCMRGNGVPDFPDPDPDAGLLIPKSMADTPQFQRAEEQCAPLLGKPGSQKK